MKHPNSVEIVNPIDGYARTSYRRAKYFVGENVAEFTPDGKLLFTQSVGSLKQAFRGPLRPPVQHSSVRHSAALPDTREFPTEAAYWDGRSVFRFHGAPESVDGYDSLDRDPLIVALVDSQRRAEHDRTVGPRVPVPSLRNPPRQHASQ